MLMVHPDAESGCFFGRDAHDAGQKILRGDNRAIVGFARVRGVFRRGAKLSCGNLSPKYSSSLRGGHAEFSAVVHLCSNLRRRGDLRPFRDAFDWY